MKLITAVAMIGTMALGACAEYHPCYEMTGAAEQQCEADVAARMAALPRGGGGNGGGQTPEQSRAVSGAMNPSETKNGPTGVTDSGESTGFSAISG